MTTGLFLTAFGLGLRHGIDWDHIAAIADLSSTAETRRRGFWLSFLYSIGHALVVMVLGLVAILFGASLPPGADVWMGRIVAVTLIALGAWVLVELARKGREFRLRSRWILVLGGTFAGLRRVRRAATSRRVTIRHDHPHPHVEGSADSPEHDLPHAHDHDHLPADVAGDPTVPLPEAQSQLAGAARPHRALGARYAAIRSAATHSHGPGTSRYGNGQGTTGERRSHRRIHSHSHSHDVVLSESASSTGNGTAAGIGLLHGIGFESPTQIAVFVASTSVVGAWAGTALLAAWVVGLLFANSALAALAGYGLLGAERNFVIYATVAVLVGVASLAMGVLLLSGLEILPEL